VLRCVESHGVALVNVVSCEYCQAQYTTKAKLVKHWSIKHPDAHAQYKKQLQMTAKKSVSKVQRESV